MNNKSADELDEIVDWHGKVALEAFFENYNYGKSPKVTITKELLEKHRSNAKAKLKSLIQDRERKAITKTLQALMTIKYPPSGKQWHFSRNAWTNSLTDATNRIEALTKEEK